MMRSCFQSFSSIYNWLEHINGLTVPKEKIPIARVVCMCERVFLVAISDVIAKGRKQNYRSN